MKRLHAILLLLRIAACVAVMIGKEVWLAVNRERSHAKRRRANRQAAARICHRL